MVDDDPLNLLRMPSATPGQGDTDAQSDAASYAGRAEALSTHVYTFDHVYGQNASQQKVYENTARAVVDSSLQGCEETARDRPTDRPTAPRAPRAARRAPRRFSRLSRLARTLGAPRSCPSPSSSP